LLLEACIYRLLKLCCREQPYYLSLIELFLQSSYQTEIGQTLDLITAPQGNVDLGRFTEKRYKSIVKYKTAFYSFYLPVAAAMYMAGIDGEKEHANAKKILLEMGEFFQIQDDYLDLFGDPSVTGKIGTDIQDNKCSWLVVQCLQRASQEQRQLLQVPARPRIAELPGKGQSKDVSRVGTFGSISRHCLPHATGISSGWRPGKPPDILRCTASHRELAGPGGGGGRQRKLRPEPVSERVRRGGGSCRSRALQDPRRWRPECTDVGRAGRG